MLFAPHLALAPALLFAAVLGPALASAELRPQDPPAPKREKEKQEEKPVVWPKLEGDAPQRIHRIQEELPKLAADDDAGFDRMRAGVATIGAAAGPRLLKDLAKAGDNEVLVKRLRELLDLAVTDRALAPLLALELENSATAVRLWSAERLLGWTDSRTLDAARARYAKEKDPFVKNTLLLLRTSLGDAETLPDLEKLLRKEWARWRAPAHAALGGLRSKATTEDALQRLRSAEEENDRLFALRILAGAGDKSAIDSIAPYLDADSRSMREAAVNALRAIVDHQDPLYEVGVFDLIQLVEEWKKRLPTIKR